MKRPTRIRWVALTLLILWGCGKDEPKSGTGGSSSAIAGGGSSTGNPDSSDVTLQSAPPSDDTENDRLLVKFRNGTSEAQMDDALGNHAKNSRKYAHHNRRGDRKGPDFFDSLVAVEVTGEDGSAVKERLSRDSSVEYVQTDNKVSVANTPNDPRYPELWGMAKIQAAQAWDLNTGSAQVVVAVIDTGVDYTHPDLSANMWINGDEFPSNGKDDDNNGYVDDVYGYDFFNKDADPKDDHFHGTHVSGTIGGVGNNAIGVAGLNWNVRIMAMKFLSSGGSGFDGDAILCVQYAINNGAHILSNSWGGGGPNQAMQDAINAATGSGLLFVAAAGNSNSNQLFYPAAYDNVLCASATDSNDAKASFSNFGTYVDVAAPGVGILSTVLSGNYASYSGTSMACPHVAGLAALLKSRNFSLSNSQIQTLIQSSADDLGSPGRDDNFGYGRIHAYRALTMTNPGSTNFPTVQITAPTSGTVFNSPLAIYGTATGSAFSFWKLDYSLPGGSSWTPISTSTSPAVNAYLGELVPVVTWPEGLVSLRLTVHDTAGFDWPSYVSVRFLTMKMDSPIPFTEYPLGAVIPVSGTAGGPGFVSYTLEYGIGESPSSWTAFVVSSNPVTNGVLGSWTVPSGIEGFVALRLTVQFTVTTRQTVRPIYIEGSQLPGWPILCDPNFPNPSPVYGYSDSPSLAIIGGTVQLLAPFGPGPNVFEATQPTTMKYLRIRQYRSVGTNVPGWPPYNSSLGMWPSPPAVGDLDKDGTPEIILTSQVPINVNSQWEYPHTLFVLRPDGSTVWSRPLSATGQYSSWFHRVIPVVDDIDGDGYLDIVAGGDSSGSLRAFDRNGNNLQGFPAVIPNADVGVYPSSINSWPLVPAVADLDGDGKKEMVFWIRTTDKIYHLLIYRSNGTPYPMTQQITISSNYQLFFSAPVIADVTGDGIPEVILQYRLPDNNYWTTLGAYKPNGTPSPGWPLTWTNGKWITGLALGDLDGDGVPEIVTSGEAPCAYRGNGTVLPGWPASILPVGNPFWMCEKTEPVIADVNGDGKPDVIIKEMMHQPKPGDWADVWSYTSTISRCNVYAFNAQGVPIGGYPKQLVIPATYQNIHDGGMAVGDLNQDGSLDLIGGSTLSYFPLGGGAHLMGRLKVWSLPSLTAGNRIEWGKYRGGPGNTGRYQSQVLGDTVAPTTSITAPAGGSTVFGVVTVLVSASDNSGAVTKAELYRDSVLVGTDSAAPYSFSWDTSNLANGSYVLTAKAFDSAGNAGTSSGVTVTVLDVAGPSMAFLSLINGQTVTGNVTVSVSATDPSGVTKVEFSVNGALQNTDTLSPWYWTWNSRKWKGKTVTLSAKGYDSKGNTTTVSISVKVQ